MINGLELINLELINKCLLSVQTIPELGIDTYFHSFSLNIPLPSPLR